MQRNLGVYKRRGPSHNCMLGNPIVRVHGVIESWPLGGPTFGLGRLGSPAVRVTGFWPPGFWPPGGAFGHGQLGNPVIRVHGVFDFQEAAEKVE